MIKSLEQLLKERADLDAKIEKARVDSRQAAFTEIERIITNVGISHAELHDHFPIQLNGTGQIKPDRASLAVKYIDPANSENTWTGRGKPAKWLQGYLQAGRKLEEFLIPTFKETQHPQLFVSNLSLKETEAETPAY